MPFTGWKQTWEARTQPSLAHLLLRLRQTEEEEEDAQQSHQRPSRPWPRHLVHLLKLRSRNLQDRQFAAFDANCFIAVALQVIV